MTQREANSKHHVIVLGASNVSRQLAVVIDTARAVCGGAVGAHIAAGYGRSFGTDSSILFRTLPGTLQSGLWAALEQDAVRGARGLITDIGNDLMYGSSSDQLLDWVSRCVERLTDRCERLVITTLPLRSVEALSPRVYRSLRNALFPSNRMTHAETCAAIERVNQGLETLAAPPGVAIVHPRDEWMGPDAIHIRSHDAPEAFHAYMRHWRLDPDAVDPVPAPSLWRRLRFLRWPAEHRRLFGIRRHHPQPAARLPDGTSISLF